MRTPPITQRLPMLGEYVRGQGTLVLKQVIQPPPPPPEIRYVFAEIHAHIETWLNKERIESWENTWDAYGKGTSVESCIVTAKEYVAKHGITPTDKIEIRVIKETDYREKLPKMAENFYDKQFHDFEQAPRRDPIPSEREIVWTSRKP